jgi:hypothetical protein
LNFDHLFIKDVEGERRVDAQELPLRVGTSSDCDIRLPGPGGEPVALLDLLDGVPFVQPVGRSASLAINGDSLETSRRLQHGDELQYYGSRIRLLIDGERLLLNVRLEDSAYVTRPPDVPEDEDVLDEEAIAPTAFKRAVETAARIEEQKTSPLKVIVGSGLALLLVASYLLFSAKSVEFEIEPAEPDAFRVSGGWFRLPIGDRILLRKGNYTVNVEKQGYFDVQQTFVVGDAQSMTVNLGMRKKPGRLLVQVDPAVEAIVTVNEGQVGKAPFGPVELEPNASCLSLARLICRDSICLRTTAFNSCLVGLKCASSLIRPEPKSFQERMRWASRRLRFSYSRVRTKLPLARTVTVRGTGPSLRRLMSRNNCR